MHTLKTSYLSLDTFFTLLSSLSFSSQPSPTVLASIPDGSPTKPTRSWAATLPLFTYKSPLPPIISYPNDPALIFNTILPSSLSNQDSKFLFFINYYYTFLAYSYFPIPLASLVYPFPAKYCASTSLFRLLGFTSNPIKPNPTFSAWAFDLPASPW